MYVRLVIVHLCNMQQMIIHAGLLFMNCEFVLGSDNTRRLNAATLQSPRSNIVKNNENQMDHVRVIAFDWWHRAFLNLHGI